MTREALQNFVGSSVSTQIGGRDASSILGMEEDGTFTLTGLRHKGSSEASDAVYELEAADIEAITQEYDRLVLPANLREARLLTRGRPAPEHACGPDSSIDTAANH